MWLCSSSLTCACREMKSHCNNDSIPLCRNETPRAADLHAAFLPIPPNADS